MGCSWEAERSNEVPDSADVDTDITCMSIGGIHTMTKVNVITAGL